MSDDFSLTQKPYLIRAIYQWIVDNQWTPHLIVAAPAAGWVSGLSDNFLQDEILVLNISPSAAPDCVIENDGVYFSGRFQGKSCKVAVAIEAVTALIARENGQGFHFDLPENIDQGPQKKKTSIGKKTASHLKIIR